jgi:hypothetical protein
MPNTRVSESSAAADGIEPMIDQWYLRQDTQEKFVVTDYDEREGAVEIQTADGNLDELDRQTWDSLPLILSEQSQDWTAPIDNEPADDDVMPGPDEGASDGDSNDPDVGSRL